MQDADVLTGGGDETTWHKKKPIGLSCIRKFVLRRCRCPKKIL
jgi:hypothetical protein